MLEADWSKSEVLNHHWSVNYHDQLTNKCHSYSSGGIQGGRCQVNIGESDATGWNTLSCDSDPYSGNYQWGYHS